MAHGMTNRRTVLRGALSGFVGLSLVPFARRGLTQESLAIVPVSDDFVMLTGGGGNILVLSLIHI